MIVASSSILEDQNVVERLAERFRQEPGAPVADDPGVTAYALQSIESFLREILDVHLPVLADNQAGSEQFTTALSLATDRFADVRWELEQAPHFARVFPERLPESGRDQPA